MTRHRYSVGGKVGEGAFASVFCAHDRASGAKVALKRVRVDMRTGPSGVLRELWMFRLLAGVSPHVVPLLDVYTHGTNIVLVMPFVPSTLHSLLTNRDVPLAEPYVACLSRMLLCGLSAIHAEGLVHRDIKPANLLLSADGVLLLADLGQTRELPNHQNASLSHAVATRWYRAPELLFGSRRYDAGVDVWAVGCVLAQLLTLSPLLPGESDIDQLLKVVAFLGSPTAERWPAAARLPDFGKIELPADVPPTPLATLMPLTSSPAMRLVEGLLRYEAAERTTTRDALRSPWIARARCRPMSCDELQLLTQSTKAGMGRAGDAVADAGAMPAPRPVPGKAPRLSFPHHECGRSHARAAGVARARALRSRLAVR